MFSPELVKFSADYSLFAVSASSANKEGIWVHLSAVRTCFHSGTSKAVVGAQWWYVHLSSQQVELLPAMITLVRYLLCSQENKFISLFKFNFSITLVCNNFTFIFLII